MAAAALIALYVYLNFRQGPDSLPADEVCLTFATVAIHSCAEAANAAAIDKQIQQLIDADVQQRGVESAWQQQEHFGCAQVCGNCLHCWDATPLDGGVVVPALVFNPAACTSCTLQ
jgi:hypothetical protein